MKTFVNFADFLQDHKTVRHGAYLIAAVLAIMISGYHFGTFDQVFHLTYLKKIIDPTLYPGDPFLSFRWYHFSYFWFLFIPLFNAGVLEIGMFIVHVCATYATFWLFWELSDLLFNSPPVSTLTLISLIFPHIGFPGFQIIEFSLLNRTFVLPILLFCILLYLREKKILAFFILGATFNLHAIYAFFVLSMFLFNELQIFNFKHIYKPLLMLTCFIIAGMPVLIWRMQTGSGIDFSLQTETLDLASRSMLYTVYYPFGMNMISFGNLLAGIGTAWALLLGLRIAPKNQLHIKIKNFCLAISILILMGSITSYALPISILIQMQLLRAGVFLLYFSMMYLAYFICKQREDRLISSSGFAILALSLVIHITPLITLLIWSLIKNYKNIVQKPWFLVGLVIGIQILIFSVSLQINLWSPGFHVFGPNSAWRDVQEWAKENTPKNAVFITPPHLFGHYVPDWRVFSERESVVTLPEMMEIPFNPSYTKPLIERFDAIAPGAIQLFNGNYRDSIEITRQAFYKNSTLDFQNLACQFSADYLVVEIDHQFKLQTVYKNPEFIIYQLPGCETTRYN